MSHTVKFPAHMVAAVKKSLNDFAKDGFIYQVANGQTDSTGNYFLDIYASDQELIKLGIKIGYNLAKESTCPVS